MSGLISPKKRHKKWKHKQKRTKNRKRLVNDVNLCFCCERLDLGREREEMVLCCSSIPTKKNAFVGQIKELKLTLRYLFSFCRSVAFFVSVIFVWDFHKKIGHQQMQSTKS